MYEGTLYFFHCRVIFTHVRTSEFNWLYVHKSIKRVPKVSTAMHTQKLTKMLKKSWANFNFFPTLTLIRPHSSPILFPWNQLNSPPYFSKIYEKEKSKRSYDERWAKSVMVNKNLGGKKRNACSNKHLQASTTRSPQSDHDCKGPGASLIAGSSGSPGKRLTFKMTNQDGGSPGSKETQHLVVKQSFMFHVHGL